MCVYYINIICFATSEGTCRNLENNLEEADSEAGISVTTVADTQQSSAHQNMECLVVSNLNTSDSVECNHSNSATTNMEERVPTLSSIGEVLQLVDCQNVNNLSLGTSEHSGLKDSAKHNSADSDLCAVPKISSRSVSITCEETQFEELLNPQQVTSPNATLTRNLPRRERYN